MRRYLSAAALAACCLLPVTPAEAAIRMRPASCPAKADASFLVRGARGEVDGVASEYQWIARQRPGWKPVSQALIQGKRDRYYDLITIAKGRKQQVICFDITGFFGKTG